jgi:hypothetical protein
VLTYDVDVSLHTWRRVMQVSLVVALVAVALVDEFGSPTRTSWGLWTVTVGAATFLVIRFLSRSNHPDAVAAASALVACSVALSILGGPDVYPVSRYPMYSNAKSGQGDTTMIYWRGTTFDGEVVSLAPPIARQASLALISAGDMAELESLARLAGEGLTNLTEIRVVKERVGISPPPKPVEKIVFESIEVLSVSLDSP